MEIMDSKIDIQTGIVRIKPPKEYKYVASVDWDCGCHCHEVKEIRVDFSVVPAITEYISKEGTEVDARKVIYHSDALDKIIDDVMCCSKRKRWSVAMMDDAVAAFGILLNHVVAEFDPTGKLRLLPEKEQKHMCEFKVSEKHRKAFKECEKRWASLIDPKEEGK